MMDVENRVGSGDCGLSAVAFATALANGAQLGEVKFKQDAMRSHLYKSFNQGALTMFPFSHQECHARAKSMDTIELYCSCKMPRCQDATNGRMQELVPHRMYRCTCISFECTMVLQRLFTVAFFIHAGCVYTHVTCNNNDTS